MNVSVCECECKCKCECECKCEYIHERVSLCDYMSVHFLLLNKLNTIKIVAQK